MSNQQRNQNDVDGWIEQLKSCQTLPESQVKALCERGRQVLMD